MPLSIPKSDAATFTLGQHWAGHPDPDYRPCSVRVTWSEQALDVMTDLADDEIFSHATGDNQQMWTLGDVFEMFIQLEDRCEYVELHVTPNNHRLHLALPGVLGRASPDSEPLSFEAMQVHPVGFDSRVELIPGGWRVHAHIPAKILGLDTLEVGMRLRASFCRYDASKGKDPILSSSSPHPVIAFHRPNEWTQAVLTP